MVAARLPQGVLISNDGDFAYAGAPSSRQIVQTEALLPGSPAFGKGVINALGLVRTVGVERDAEAAHVLLVAMRRVAAH